MFLNIDLVDEFLNNYLYCPTFTNIDSVSVQKGYQLITHAYSALKLSDELYRCDAISNLRKAINYRVSELFSNLGVEKLELSLGKDRRFEKLEVLGLVKPLLLNKLLLIRNDIEYNFKNPPSLDECEKLADVVWYLYKSTDRFCTQRRSEWVAEWREDGLECFMQYDFDFDQHKVIKFFGRFPRRYLSENRTHKSILLSNVELKNFAEQAHTGMPNFHTFSCKAEIEIKNLHNYIEILTCCLGKW